MKGPQTGENYMEISRSLDKFRNIESVSTRQKLLDELFANLQPSDVWYLTRILSERQLFVDIISLLPSELLINILSYVSAQEVLKWQRVSRRWKDRLSEEVICSHINRLEFPSDVPSLRPQDSILSKYDSLRMNVFRSIAIKQSNKLCTRREISDLRPYIMAYWGGRLVTSGIMVGSDLRYTMLYDLYSDKRSKLLQSRESWYNLTLSEDICVGITSLGKCKVWNLKNPSTCQERQLLSANVRDLASSKKITGMITADREITIWDTEQNEELSTGYITDYLEKEKLILYKISINASREYIILLASRDVKHDVCSCILIFNFEQKLIFKQDVAFKLESRLYVPIQQDCVYVTCSGIRSLTKINLNDFSVEDIGGFLTTGDSLIGVPYKDSIFMLEGSYLTRLTLTTYSEIDDKWSYFGILFSLDKTSRMFDLQGDGHYICARMETGILVFSFNLYDYQYIGIKENGIVEYS
ncbi:hypothetical protein V1511DRAFT_352463 [Dipodascopsis uninucleata]